MARIEDVARASGVAPSTVSYALSGKRPVSADTRRRVEEAVRKLDYRPNAGARMLAGRRTNIFAVTEPFRTDTHGQTHMAFVLATAIAARRHDYDILLLTDEQASAGMRRVATSGLVDAVLVLDVAPADERVDLARALDIPSIFIGIPDDTENLQCVDLDFVAAAKLAVDRLADRGHRSIALLGESAVSYIRSNFPPRVRDAFRDRCAARGVASTFAAIGEVQSHDDDARRALALALESGATGIVIHNQQDMQRAVLNELEARGLKVPDDVSVVALGSSPSDEGLPQRIDTIPLIPAQSCDMAVELAVRSIDSLEPPAIHLIPPTLVDHGTVATPPKHRH